MIYELVYVDPSITRSDMYETTAKGEAAVNLNWLSPENDPVSPKSRRLTERQQNTLIAMYQRENEAKLHGGITTSQSANENNFYKRLQDRRLPAVY